MLWGRWGIWGQVGIVSPLQVPLGHQRSRRRKRPPPTVWPRHPQKPRTPIPRWCVPASPCTPLNSLWQRTQEWPDCLHLYPEQPRQAQHPAHLCLLPAPRKRPWGAGGPWAQPLDQSVPVAGQVGRGPRWLWAPVLACAGCGCIGGLAMCGATCPPAGLSLGSAVGWACSARGTQEMTPCCAIDSEFWGVEVKF